MGVDPNDVIIDWSSSDNDGSSTATTVSSLTTSTTGNPLITSCTEGLNPLISHEVFTKSGSEKK